MVTEAEVLSFCDNTGYLSLEGRKALLVSKKACRVVNGEIMVNPEFIIKDDKGKTMWDKLTSAIDFTLDMHHKRKAGKMGVDLKKAEEVINKNDIKAEDINF